METQSLFIDFMGDSPIIRILDYLLTERDLDFSITDLAKNSQISRATLYRIWDQLIKNEILLSTRTIGKAKLFKLNKENPKIKKLIEIDDLLILEELQKKSQKKITVKVPA
ncbi:helix-turn-helix domain-containing protein [Candidatus Woesearchaeota archaeon]|nr:helix-turn-helix domain-containing protein [Candidatus Woesearchaeota archaeon]